MSKNTENPEKTTEVQKDKKTKKKKFTVNKRKLKYGSVAAAITVVFTAAVVLLNVLVTSLTDRYPLKLDLTADKVFEVSQETIDFLDTLESKVDITVMQDEATLELGSKYDKIQIM